MSARIRSLALVLAVAVGVFFVVLALHQAYPARAQGDNEPPVISGVRIGSITSSSTFISWVTDEMADSVVHFGISKNLGFAREPDPSLTEHGVVLTDLEPATTYYFRAVSSDSSGNQQLSGTYQFTTRGTKPVPGVETVSNEDQKQLAERVAELVDKITDEKALAAVSDKVAAAGEGVLDPPRIIGEPTLEIGADLATIIWETDKEANSMVSFATDGEFKNNNDYAREEGNADELTLRHRVTLHGLRPDTGYHYQITSKPNVGPTGKSDDRTFTTKSILPQIANLRLQKIEEDSATVAWSTQVPAAALVEYTNISTGEMKSIGNPSFQISHSIRLPDLKFKSAYSVVVKARTQSGDEISSRPVTFVTTKDDAPPVISQVANESTLYPGAEAKVQTIVSWETDEPAICQFFYGQGLIIAAADEQSLAEETGPLLRHVQVVTEFLPSTVYKFWVRCRDRNDNPARSEDFVLFTPEKEKSIIDIILENFEGTFGWVKNIGK